jgi:hypothetical protein
MLLALFVSVGAFSQAKKNLALTASPSQSDNRAAPYDAKNFNDQYINTSTWSWISGSAGTNSWMMYEWSTAQTFDEMVLYVGSNTTRVLTGGVIQIWNGSSWVNHDTWSISLSQVVYSGGLYFYSITFKAATTTKLRLYNLASSGSQASNPTICEWEIFLNKVYTTDAAIAAVESPTSPVDPNVSEDVVVTLQNMGNDTLKSVDIYWSIDGTKQTGVYKWTGSLPQYDTAMGLKLGSYTFALGAHELKAWTESPNAKFDSNAFNDTGIVKITSCYVMSGNYVIDPTGNGDYKTFNEAIAALYSCGINGHTHFTVKKGVYTEQLLFKGAILGTGPNAQITFDGGTWNDVEIKHNGSGTNRSVIVLDNADWVTLKNFKLTHTGNNQLGVWVTNHADHNTLDSLHIVVARSTSTNYPACIWATGSETSYSTATDVDYLTVQNCYGRWILWNPFLMWW